jgi:alanine dehydrogenase
MRVLLISRRDVEGIASMKEVMDAVEKAFRAKGLGKVEMPPKVYVNFPKGDFRVMPCYIPELGFSSIKIVNSHPENPERYGLPTVMATIV